VTQRLDHHHRHTLAQVMAHPIGHNIQWRDVEILLERLGDLRPSHTGGWTVTIEGRTLRLGRVRGRELSEHQVMALRRLLRDVVVRAEAAA
jgi:hypothetical protein